MSKMRLRAQQVRWCWILPIAMTVLTATLLIVGMFEFRVNHVPDCIQCAPPAYVIATFLDRPAFYVGRSLPSVGLSVWETEILGFELLPGVFLQWFLIGLVVDRWLQGKLIENLSIRLVLFPVAFACCVLVFFRSDAPQVFWGLLTEWRMYFDAISKLGFWTPGLASLASPLWATIGVVYFGRKVWKGVWSVFANKQRLTTNDLHTANTK